MSTISPSVLADLLQHGMETGKLPYVTITSNSMAPLLRVGDQVGVERAALEALRPGDVVMVEGTAELMTHRYWQTWDENGELYLMTRGDRLIHFDSPWPVSRYIGRVARRRRGQQELKLASGAGGWLNRRLTGIIRLEMALLTGGNRPSIRDYQTNLPRLRRTNGQPYHSVRLLRRLLWLAADVLTAAVGLWARSSATGQKK